MSLPPPSPAPPPAPQPAPQLPPGSAIPPPPPPRSGSTTPTSCWPALPGARLDPLGGLVTALTILLAATTAAALSLAAAFIYRSNVIDRFLDGSEVSFDDLDQSDNLVQGTSVLHTLGFLTTGIVFIVWQHRFAKNAERFTGPLSLRPSWAIGGWFIPLAAPVLAAIQLDQADGRSGDRRPHGGRARGLVMAWLVTWYVGVIVSVVANVVRPDYDDADVDALQDFGRADRIAGAGFALIAIAGVLALLMVRKLSAGQRDAAG